MVNMKKVTSYMMSRLPHFLLLAVILTAGLTLRMAAVAKYTSFVNDYTSAVAGDFFFTSDYLFAPEDNAGHYQINSWNGKSYNVAIEIRNYENALRYNATGTDLFYWVDAGVYQDSGCTVIDPTFQNAVTVAYGKNNINKSASKNLDNGTPRNYGFIPGLSEFNNKAGAEEVLVGFEVGEQNALASGTRYLKITAHTVPLSEVSSLTMLNGTTSSTSRGVYYSTLEAVFDLRIVSTQASIEGIVNPSSDYTIRYRLFCNNATEGSTGSVQTKVYYKAADLTPDVSLGNSYTEGASYTGPYTAAAGWRYVQASVNVGGSEDLYFYKKTLSTVINPDNQDDYFASVVINSDDIDTTPYSITAATVDNGSVSALTDLDGTALPVGETSGLPEAQMGSFVKATLNPDTGYIVYGVSVTYGGSNNLSVSSMGNNQYRFEMTNSPVTITPAFVPGITVTSTGHGTISTSKAGAPSGEVIYITITPDAGYKLATMVFDNMNLTRTELSETLFSFVMPENPVSISVSFCEDEESGGGETPQP